MQGLTKKYALEENVCGKDKKKFDVILKICILWKRAECSKNWKKNLKLNMDFLLRSKFTFLIKKSI